MEYGARWGGYDQPDEDSEMDTTKAIPRNRGHRTSTPHARAPEQIFRPPAARTGTGASSVTPTATKQMQPPVNRPKQTTVQISAQRTALPAVTANVGMPAQSPVTQIQAAENPQLQTVMDSIQAMMNHMTSVENRINRNMETRMNAQF